MKLILMMLLISWTSGCDKIMMKFPELEDPIERCVLMLPTTNSLGKCRCHLYRIHPEGIGRISESVDHPVSYCDRAVVFRGDTWAKLRALFGAIYDYVNDEIYADQNSSSGRGACFGSDCSRGRYE